MPSINKNFKNLLRCKGSTACTEQKVKECESSLITYFQLLLEWQKQEESEVQSEKV